MIRFVLASIAAIRDARVGSAFSCSFNTSIVPQCLSLAAVVVLPVTGFSDELLSGLEHDVIKIIPQANKIDSFFICYRFGLTHASILRVEIAGREVDRFQRIGFTNRI